MPMLVTIHSMPRIVLKRPMQGAVAKLKITARVLLS